MSAALRRLAAYGSLRPGQRNHAEVADLPGTWEPGWVTGTYVADGWHGYPGLRLDGGDEVPVEVLTSDTLPAHWERLDAFEGVGYRRVEVLVALASGTVRAQVYVLA